MIKIGYRIGGSFEEAEKNNYRISAMMKKQNDGEVVIILYEDKIPVETIHWDEWMKYKCNHLKREKIDAGFTDANTDYEPYSEKFEKILASFRGERIIMALLRASL